MFKRYGTHIQQRGRDISIERLVVLGCIYYGPKIIGDTVLAYSLCHLADDAKMMNCTATNF